MITYKVLAEFADVVRNLDPTFPNWIERDGYTLNFKWCLRRDRIWVAAYPYYEDNDPPAYLYVEWEIVDDELSFFESRRFLTDIELDLYLEWFVETHNGRDTPKNLSA